MLDLESGNLVGSRLKLNVTSGLQISGKFVN